MFETLEPLAPDSILGVTIAYRRDTSPLKVDLGVGVYRDGSGNTPVPAAVREAERALIGAQTTKSYVGPAGNVEFNERIIALALGPLAAGLADRTSTIQTVGGCGALRLGAELVKAARPDTVVHVSDPTWANHEPLIGSSGMRLERYPYFDAARRAVAFDAMLSCIDKLPAASLVLLHACCHNPTGADLSPDQWQELAAVIERRGLVPFVDLAYQGLGDDLETDAVGLRTLAERVPELLLAVSCSKNFGLYRERTGALAVISASNLARTAVATHQARLARRMYSMPPDHGAATVRVILSDAELRADWESELDEIRARMIRLREGFAEALRRRSNSDRFDFVAHHRGMFSRLGLTVDQVHRLRQEHGVYMVDDSRINVAGLPEDGLDDLAKAVVSVLG